MSAARLRLVTPPAPAVTLAEAKDNANVDHDEKDALISGFIKAAGALCERHCGRAFGPQTWEYRLDAFPASHLDVPWGPLVSVTSLAYLDAAGVSQTLLAPGVWEIEALSDPGTVRLLGSWPATFAGSNAVTLTYVAGLGWPDEIKQAVLLLVAHWFNNREASSVEPRHDVPFGVAHLLTTHRRMFV